MHSVPCHWPQGQATEPEEHRVGRAAGACKGGAPRASVSGTGRPQLAGNTMEPLLRGAEGPAGVRKCRPHPFVGERTSPHWLDPGVCTSHAPLQASATCPLPGGRQEPQGQPHPSALARKVSKPALLNASVTRTAWLFTVSVCK